MKLEEETNGAGRETEEMTTLRLYMPLRGELFEPNDEGSMSEEGVELFGAALMDYDEEIVNALESERSPEEAVRGIMCWYDGDDSVNQKVRSVIFQADYREGNVWCVAECQVQGTLTESELYKLKKFVQSQASDGWGEGLEERPVNVGDCALYLHIWQSEGWSVLTEAERFPVRPEQTKEEKPKQPQQTKKHRHARQHPNERQ